MEIKIQESPEDGHTYWILLIRIVFYHVSTNLPLHCLFDFTMNIYLCFYFVIARDIVTVLLILVNIHQSTYTFSHAHTEHTRTSTHVWSAHKRKGNNQAQEPGWEGWNRGRKAFVRDKTLAHNQWQQTDVSNLKRIRSNRASSKATRLFLAKK